MSKTFKKIISAVLVLSMVLTLSAISVSANGYPSEEYWATEALNAGVKNNILYGRNNGDLDPETYLTRAEAAAMIVRAFGATVKADISGYSDMDSSKWYYDEISKAVHMGVFVGSGDGKMNPDSFITRAELFTAVARALVLSSNDYSSLDKFNDSANVSEWSKEFLSILVKKGYVNGDNLGNLNPKANIKRAEMAQFMHNIFKTYFSEKGTYSSVEKDSVMINTPDVNLSNVIIEGDLVIGDGAGYGTIELTNVTIKGRLLVRGSKKVKLVYVTVGEDVVVKNINSNVHFDNYRSENVFKNINIITSATFKPTSGGGGGSTPTPPTPPTTTQYNVNFYMYDTDLVDTVLVDENTAFGDNLPVLADSDKIVNEGYIKNTDISDVYTEESVHEIEFGWWYNPTGEEWLPFDETVVITQDTDVYYKGKKISVWVSGPQVGGSNQLSVWYDNGTRLYDSLKDFVYIDGNRLAINAARLATDYDDKVIDKLKELNIIDNNNNILDLSFLLRFSQVLGEANVEDFIVDSAKEMFSTGSNDALNEGIEDFISTNKQGMKNLLSDVTVSATAKDYIVNLAETKWSDSFLTTIGCPALTKAQFIDAVRNNTYDAYSKVINYLVDHSDITPDYIVNIAEYVSHDSDLRDAVVDEIIEEVYRADLDLLVSQVINNEQFSVTNKTLFVAEGLYNKLYEDYSYNDILTLIPQKDKLFKIYPENKFEEIYQGAFDNLVSQIPTTLADGQTAWIDCGLKFVIHPVEDVYAPLYNSFVTILSGNIGDRLYYDGNKYLQEMVKLFSPDALFAGNQDQLRSFEEYYNIMVKHTILSDDLVKWYKGELSKDEVDALLLNYEDVVLKYINILTSYLEGYADGSIDPSNKYFNAAMDIIKSRFGSIYNKVLDWYLTSPLNKEYTSSDYAQFRNIVKELYDATDIETDGIFDDPRIDTLLSKLDGFLVEENASYVDFAGATHNGVDIYGVTVKGITGTFAVIGDDMYELKVKDITITLVREVTAY
ncbi:MAG: S-layer homology domain-containing protein [Clostridia bacterium]|nr:S-layer homology domain-containing protein [Clostridia bacterium]